MADIFSRYVVSPNSNIEFGFCINHRIETSSQNISELRDEMSSDIQVYDNDGNVTTYNNLKSLFNDYPQGLIIVRTCPNTIGSHSLSSQEAIKDEYGNIIRYKCTYDGCDACNGDSINNCQRNYCAGYSKSIIECQEDDGTCHYYNRSDGSDETENYQEKDFECDCADPIWVMKQSNGVYYVTAYSRKYHKICHNANMPINEFLSSDNSVNCGDKVLLNEGNNYVTDSTGNGIYLEIMPDEEDDILPCDIIEIYVNGDLAYSDTYENTINNGAQIDVTKYGNFSAYNIEYKIKR